MRIAVLIIAIVVGGWLAFDGTRALSKGDYVTPRSGQLGPWSRVVSILGVDPRSAVMKWTHVVLGLAWIASAAVFIVSAPPGRIGLLGCSILTLWYLPLGTVLSIAEIALLCLPALRNLR